MGNMTMELDVDGGVWGLTLGGFQWFFLLIHPTHLSVPHSLPAFEARKNGAKAPASGFKRSAPS